MDKSVSADPGAIGRLPKTMTSADEMLNSLTPELLSEINFNNEKEAKGRVEAYLQAVITIP